MGGLTAHVWNYNEIKRTGRKILFIGRLHEYFLSDKTLLLPRKLNPQNCLILKYIFSVLWSTFEFTPIYQ